MLQALQNVKQTDTVLHMTLEVELSRTGQHQGKFFFVVVYILRISIT